MDTYDTAEIDEHPLLSRVIKVGLFLLAQGIAVMLVAFLALLVSLGASWSATTEQASLLQHGEGRVVRVHRIEAQPVRPAIR